MGNIGLANLLAASVHWGGFKWTGSFTAVDLIAASTNALNGALLARRPDHYKQFTIVGIILMALRPQRFVGLADTTGVSITGRASVHQGLDLTRALPYASTLEGVAPRMERLWSPAGQPGAI